jgi:hypothetical protein
VTVSDNRVVCSVEYSLCHDLMSRQSLLLDTHEISIFV